ncbi:hypothetical protein LPUS_00497 [Lasallia pustulata]|uniref:Uncharacterized protein n=1 Tax=Lasallia pustulata TaxID=136370 RepID=A0A1W5CYS8_9LECA|nr:hypothetical protein LPUS_00497 [Lasallia pustulata]
MLKQCFTNDGHVAPANFPCDPNADVSACCGQGNVCATSLACLYGTVYVPATCTVRNWGDLLPPECSCPPFWPYDNATLDYRDSFIRCADGSICCGYDNTACCAQGRGHIEIDYQNLATIPSDPALLSAYYDEVHPTTLPISTNTTISTSPSLVITTPLSVTATTTTTSTNPSLAVSTLTVGANSPTAPSTASNVITKPVALPITAKAGISVGAAVIAILLITVFILLWHRQRRPLQVLYQSTSGTQFNRFTAWLPPVELQGIEAARELEGDQSIGGLEANLRMPELEGRMLRA